LVFVAWVDWLILSYSVIVESACFILCAFAGGNLECWWLEVSWWFGLVNFVFSKTDSIPFQMSFNEILLEDKQEFEYGGI